MPPTGASCALGCHRSSQPLTAECRPSLVEEELPSSHGRSCVRRRCLPVSLAFPVSPTAWPSAIVEWICVILCIWGCNIWFGGNMESCILFNSVKEKIAYFSYACKCFIFHVLIQEKSHHTPRALWSIPPYVPLFRIESRQLAKKFRQMILFIRETFQSQKNLNLKCFCEN